MPDPLAVTRMVLTGAAKKGLIPGGNCASIYEALTVSNSGKRHFRLGKEIEELRAGVHNLISAIEPAEASSAATAEGSGEVGWRSHRPGRILDVE